jgi:serine/threonine protein kinase
MPPSNVSHYELIGKIAEGGMGVVYKARDIRLDRIVALKFLSSNLPSSQDKIELFFHEARAFSKLNHPNIAPSSRSMRPGRSRFLLSSISPAAPCAKRFVMTMPAASGCRFVRS